MRNSVHFPRENKRAKITCSMLYFLRYCDFVCTEYLPIPAEYLILPVFFSYPEKYTRRCANVIIVRYIIQLPPNLIILVIFFKSLLLKQTPNNQGVWGIYWSQKLLFFDKSAANIFLSWCDSS